MPTLIMGPHSASVSLITTLPNTHLLTVDHVIVMMCLRQCVYVYMH